MTSPPARRRRYDWETVRAVYVEGRVSDSGERSYPTLAEVADLFGVPHNRCREAAAREHWTDRRAAFQASVEKVRQEKRAQDLAKEAVDVDAKALTLSKVGFQLVQARIGEIGQALQARNRAKKAYEDLLAENGNDHTDPRLQAIDFDPWAPSPIDAREVQTLAATATQWHALAMKSLGEVETTRTEITGAAGAPLEVSASGTLRAELTTDDPARLHALLAAVSRSSLAQAEPAGLPGPDAGGGPGDESGAAS